MIGIICKDSERKTVHEFFELFKTPWGFFMSGCNYDVVISTLQENRELDAGLIILYSSEPTQYDEFNKIAVSSAIADYLTYQNEFCFPIYGKLAILRGKGSPLIYSKSNSDVIALELFEPSKRIVRVGYDLFSEVAFLLSEGQPVENALIPSLEFHISLLRNWILNAGMPVVEIPPFPWGYQMVACLTHDVDFVSIRQHKFDHTFWGFLYRALIDTLVGFVRGNYSLSKLVKNWITVFSLPLVYLGVLRDFWDEFDDYAAIEKELRSTFFIIPFKNVAGENVQDKLAARRATRYDIDDIRNQVQELANQGFEIGLHGIDAWHNPEKGKGELNRILDATDQTNVGVRIHWLCYARNSPLILEQAGFDYDATSGYNETIGYRSGTIQAFRPAGVTRLLELPLHIQDSALFYPGGLALTDAQAWRACMSLLDTTLRFGGLLTVLWHMRSLSPERLWGEFYSRFLKELRAKGAWFGTARQVVQWFRRRRSVVFEDYSFIEGTLCLKMKSEDHGSAPPILLRIHRPRKGEDVKSKRATHIDILFTEKPLMIHLD